MARSIRENIILSFVAFSLISLILVGIISLVFINMIGQTTTSMSTSALKNQIKENINQTAVQNSQIINQKLSEAEAMVNAMSIECENLFRTESTYTNRTIYYDFFFEYDRGKKLFPNDTYLDSLYDVYLSWSYASYYFPGSNSTNYLNLLAANSALYSTINKTAHMDYIFQNIHESIPEIRWLYIAFANTDLFINYPGSVVGGTDSERNSEPFRATQEDWYTDVRNGDGNIVFTEPYFDPIDGALLITIGKAIYDPKPPNVLLGCIFADLTIESIKEKIIDITILDTGYAALIQESGLVVAHPEYTATNPDEDLPVITDIEVNLDGESALSSSQVNLITSGKTDVIQYRRKNADFYLAYTPVGKGDYICLIIVPVSEAIASVTPLQQRIGAATASSFIQVSAMIVIAVVVSLSIGIWMANRIIEPITHLTQIASNMATDKVREDILGELDLKIDQELMEQDDEVGDLTRAFKGMLVALKKEEKEGKDKLDDSFWG